MKNIVKKIFTYGSYINTSLDISHFDFKANLAEHITDFIQEAVTSESYVRTCEVYNYYNFVWCDMTDFNLEYVEMDVDNYDQDEAEDQLNEVFKRDVEELLMSQFPNYILEEFVDFCVENVLTVEYFEFAKDLDDDFDLIKYIKENEIDLHNKEERDLMMLTFAS